MTCAVQVHVPEGICKFKPEFSLGSASTGRREALGRAELQNPLPERRSAQRES